MANAPKWFTASYGNDGLDVTFYTNKREYEKAIRDLETAHESGGWDIDSYTYGDAKMPPRRKRAKPAPPKAE